MSGRMKSQYHLHFLSIRIRLDQAGALRGEPVHPGDEIGTDKVDEIDWGKTGIGWPYASLRHLRCRYVVR